MKIVPKKIQSMQGMDGYAFSADIHVDGKKVGYVHDEGCGGCLIIDIPDKVLKQIKAHLKTLPSAKDEYGTDVEIFLSGLVLGELDDRDIRRMLKKPQFITSGSKTVKYFPGCKWEEKKASLKKKFPEYIWLNEMPFNEAKDLLQPPLIPAKDGGPSFLGGK